MIQLFKRWMDRRRRMKQLAKEDRYKMTLKQLREVMLAIDEYLMEKNLSRQERKHFWDDFKKYEMMRNDIFDELLNNGTLDKQIEEAMTCQKKRRRT